MSIGQDFIAALPPQVRDRFRPTQAAGAALQRAVSRGWTPCDLAAECCRDIHTAKNAGAIVHHRLTVCADTNPTHKQARFKQPKPWCGQCDDHLTRWYETTDGKVIRCPHCWTDPTGAN